MCVCIYRASCQVTHCWFLNSCIIILTKTMAASSAYSFHSLPFRQIRKSKRRREDVLIKSPKLLRPPVSLILNRILCLWHIEFYPRDTKSLASNCFLYYYIDFLFLSKHAHLCYQNTQNNLRKFSSKLFLLYMAWAILEIKLWVASSALFSSDILTGFLLVFYLYSRRSEPKCTLYLENFCLSCKAPKSFLFLWCKCEFIYMYWRRSGTTPVPHTSPLL